MVWRFPNEWTDSSSNGPEVTSAVHGNLKFKGPL